MGGALLIAAVASGRAERYVITDLAALGNEFANVLATSINAGGKVCGNNGPKGFVYESERITLLPLFMSGGEMWPQALDRAGNVVGTAQVPTGGSEAHYHAFLYRNGVLSNLGTLGGSESSAYAINASGEIVGDSSATGSRPQRAFVYRNGTMIDLGTLGGSASTAFGINDAGQIVGNFKTASGETHAFLYDQNRMIDLGTLGGKRSVAKAINNAGQIVGHSFTSTTGPRPFIYADGKMKIIPTPKSGYANAINAAGDVVGTFLSPDDEWHPFLYSKGKLIDLRNAIIEGSHWIPYQTDLVTAINDRGQILVNAWFFNSTKSRDLHRVLLLTPATLAPKIRLRGEANLRTTQAKIVIDGTGTGPIDNLTFQSNRTKGTKRVSGTRTWRFQAAVRPGANNFVIRAHGPRGDSLPLVVTVMRN